MNVSLLIVDDFYVDPDFVRNYALSQDFEVTGNYPGRRTKPFLNFSIKDTVQKIINDAGGEIIDWNTTIYNGSFQFATSRDRSWIHADQTTTWAGVCYLTPNAPVTAGTALFKHKATGFFSTPLNADGSYNLDLLAEINKDSQDFTKWEMTDRVANVYNRLVLYRGDHFHCSMDYFGQNLQDARLFQTFFFNTRF